MVKSNKTLGIILARAGSKGLVNKNIKVINGHPLIARTINTGKKSNLIDDLIVSTDSKQIAEISKNYGAEVPFTRPKVFSDDSSKSSTAIIHALDELDRIGRVYDYVVLLEPTSPLREKSDIDISLKKIINKNFFSIVSVSKAESSHPSFLYKTNSEKLLIPYTGKHPTDLRRQDIEDLYFVDGTIYCSPVNLFREKESFYHDRTLFYEVPKWKSLEIDDIYDFIMVESLMKSEELKNKFLINKLPLA